MKTNSQEDDFTGDDLTGRQPHKKVVSLEDSLTGRQVKVNGLSS